MTLTPGWSAEEIREFVYEYQLQPWGTRRQWLATQDVPVSRFTRWRNTVFYGDIELGLIPREVDRMSSDKKYHALAKEREHRQRLEKIDDLQARVRELEQTNEALGKAIGLLHQLNEQESDTSETNEPQST